MNTSSLANSVSASVRIYRALLVMYPKKFRDHYETHMVQVFRDSFRYEYHRNGISGVIDLWLHTFADLLVTAFMERLMEGSQYMFSPKLILWTGVTGAFSGMFWVTMGLAPTTGGTSFMSALVLGLGGLAGLYSQQARRGGRLGLAGFALSVIGTVLALAALRWGFTSGSLSASTIEREPALAAPAVLILLLALVTLGIGLALLGITTWRTKALLRWQGLPLGLGFLNIIEAITFWLVYYVPFSQGRNPFDPWPPQGYFLNVAVLVLLGLGWLALGTLLAIEAEVKIEQSPPAPA